MVPVLVIGCVAFVAVFVVPEIAARRRRARTTAHVLAIARIAADRLGLSAPADTPLGVRARGTIEGHVAELDAAGWVHVDIDACGLPAGLSIQRWPTGRAAEDIALCNLRKTGHVAFDAHYGVGGADDGLDRIDPVVLTATAELHDHPLELLMTHDQLIVHRKHANAPTTEGTDDLVELWNGTRELVTRLEREGVIRPTGR